MNPFSDREMWEMDRAAERRIARQEYLSQRTEEDAYTVPPPIITTDERGRVTTPAGITIGAAYVPPPPRDQGTQAEIIQKALLGDVPGPGERMLDLIDRHWLAIFLAGGVIGLVLGLVRRGAL